MFLQNKGRCYVLNVEYSIVVILQRIKKIEKRKVQRTNILQEKIFVWEKSILRVGEKREKIAQITYYVKMSLLLPKLVSLSYIKSIIYAWFRKRQFL